MMNRQDIVNAIRLIASAINETSPRKLAEELELLAKKAEETAAHAPTAPAKVPGPSAGPEKLPGTDARIAPLLEEIQELVDSGCLPKKNLSFMTKFLTNQNFTVEGAMKVLVTGREVYKKMAAAKGNGKTAEVPPLRGNDDLVF